MQIKPAIHGVNKNLGRRAGGRAARLVPTVSSPGITVHAGDARSEPVEVLRRVLHLRLQTCGNGTRLTLTDTKILCRNDNFEQ